MGINLKKQRKKLQRTVAMSANVVPTPDMLRRSHPVDVHEPLLKKRRRPQRRDLNSDKRKRYRTTVFFPFFSFFGHFTQYHFVSCKCYGLSNKKNAK